MQTTPPLHWCEFDLDDARHRADFLRVCNEVWPEFAQTDAEFAHEVRLGGAARRWLVRVEGGDDPAAAVAVERIRWNEDDAPPLAFLIARPQLREAASYRALLEPPAQFAREQGFDDLRVLAWDRETTLVELLQTMGWREVERDIDVRLDLTTAVTPAPQPPRGITLSSLAQRPELARAAHACVTAAAADIPGDEPQRIPPFDEWTADRQGPSLRDDATLLAVAGEDDVVGFCELEFSAAAPDTAWNGYTAVHPDWRNRGIATTLKLAAIDYARSIGLRSLRTENEARNAPMRLVNERLGYAPAGYRVIMRGSALLST